MTNQPWFGYQFAVLRAVPHVFSGEFVNVGVILHSRTADFLGMRAVTDEQVLHSLVPEADTELLAKYLQCYHSICEGDTRAGEVALLSPPERFHWITAPRSDLLQSSAVHEGICREPERTVNDLFADFVRSSPPPVSRS